jgi:hypothetical protein
VAPTFPPPLKVWVHRFGYGNYVAQSTRTQPKLHPAGYLENGSVNPAYILGISLWLDDLDRRPGSGLFGESGSSRP